MRASAAFFKSPVFRKYRPAPAVDEGSAGRSPAVRQVVASWYGARCQRLTTTPNNAGEVPSFSLVGTVGYLPFMGHTCSSVAANQRYHLRLVS